ncbi:hypothetical protein Tco_0271449 [Tanacetum coccineum]
MSGLYWTLAWKGLSYILNRFAGSYPMSNINDPEPDNGSVDTPLDSPFSHSDNDSDDEEVLNEYENTGTLRQERIINSFDRDDLAFEFEVLEPRLVWEHDCLIECAFDALNEVDELLVLLLVRTRDEIDVVPVSDFTWGSDFVYLGRLCRSKMSFHQALNLIELIRRCPMARSSYNAWILRSRSTKLTTGRLVNGSSCDRIDMVIKNLDLEPKIDAMMRDFLDFVVLPGGKKLSKGNRELDPPYVVMDPA